MDLEEVLARFRGDRDGVLKAALRCSSAEELLELAGERGIDLNESEAAELLAFLQHRPEELTEMELDAVAGGSGEVACLACGSTSVTYLRQRQLLVAEYRCNNCDLVFGVRR